MYETSRKQEKRKFIKTLHKSEPLMKPKTVDTKNLLKNNNNKDDCTEKKKVHMIGIRVLFYESLKIIYTERRLIDREVICNWPID